MASDIDLSHRKFGPLLVASFAVLALVTGCGGGGSSGSPTDTGTSGSGPDLSAEPGISNARVVTNPRNRLSAFVVLETEEPTRVSLKIRRNGRSVQTHGPTEQKKKHRINVIGLYASTDYQFRISAKTQNGETDTVERTYSTAALPSDFPPLHVKTAKPKKNADGIRLMSLYRWKTPSEGQGYQDGWGMIVGIDGKGKVVWYYKADHWTWNAYRMSNGHLLYIDADKRFVEIDMMGNVVQTWHAKKDLGRKPEDDECCIHHSVLEGEGNNFLALSTELRQVEGYLKANKRANVVGDEVLKFTSDGQIQKTWSMFDVLSNYKTRKQYGSRGAKWNDRYDKSTNDWSHANALAFGDEPGTLIASLRHQNWVVKWDRKSGKLQWRLGPEGDFEFPKGSEGKFNYHQHAASFLENGNLILYDNGNFRRSIDKGERFYTRVAEFELDASNVNIDKGKKGTVKQIWQYENPPKYFAPHVGDADLLPNDTVLISDGGLLENPKSCITLKKGDPNKKYSNRLWKCISNPKNLNWGRLLEVTHDQNKEKVLEIWVKDQSDDEPRGYTIYRAEYLKSLYPEGGVSPAQ